MNLLEFTVALRATWDNMADERDVGRVQVIVAGGRGFRQGKIAGESRQIDIEQTDSRDTRSYSSLSNRISGPCLGGKPSSPSRLKPKTFRGIIFIWGTIRPVVVVGFCLFHL